MSVTAEFNRDQSEMLAELVTIELENIEEWILEVDKEERAQYISNMKEYAFILQKLGKTGRANYWLPRINEIENED